MFEMITANRSPWDDMWRTMDALMQYPFNKEKSIEKTGLKSLIGRPHNIVDVKDKDGNTIAQRLEVVTTPFKKDEVKVSIKGNVLTISCGTKKEEAEKDGNNGESYIYKGISTQNYQFSLKLADHIDKNAIKAKNLDGVLTINLPFLKKEEKAEEGAVQIEVE